VSRIITENGRAVGVRLWDDSEVRARHLVASSADVEQTFQQLLDAKSLPEAFVKGLESCEHMDWSFFTAHLAMREAPHYTAAAFDPDIDRAWVMNVGYESLEDVNQHWQQIRAGKIPDPKPNCAVNSLYDPTDAPEGCYTGLIRQFAPFSLAEGGPEAWDEMGTVYGQRCIDRWAEYAPNIKDAVIEWTPFTPLDVTRRIPNMVQGDWMGGLISLDNMLTERPFAELSQYRTPYQGLYMCGATQHPHGFITFAPAYNALAAIAEDYHLSRWWR
jgi:phytoene dehydrogenase-like protein